jgi:hypothetical protein
MGVLVRPALQVRLHDVKPWQPEKALDVELCLQAPVTGLGLALASWKLK